jgi:hypothetical protein
LARDYHPIIKRERIYETDRAIENGYLDNFEEGVSKKLEGRENEKSR